MSSSSLCSDNSSIDKEEEEKIQDPESVEIFKNVQEMIEKYSKIHPDVWKHKNSGCVKEGDPIITKFKALKADEILDDATKKELKISLEKFQKILNRVEPRQLERLGHENTLNEKYNVYLSIIKDSDFPLEGTFKDLDKSVAGLKKKFSNFTFNDQNKVTGGKVSTMYVNEIKIDGLERIWAKSKEKIRKNKNGIDSNMVLTNVKSEMSQWQKDIQTSDEETRKLAQSLQDMIAGGGNVLNILQTFKNVRAKLGKVTENKPEIKTPKKENNISNIGLCGACGENKKKLFGTSKTCFDCYQEGELEKRVATIYAKERKYFKTISSKEKTKYINNIKNKYASAFERFIQSRGLDYYELLISWFEKAENLMENIQINDEDISDINDSIVVSDDDDDDDDDEEEEEKEEEEKESLYENGLPSDYDSEKEFKNKKKRNRDDYDNQLLKEVLEISIIANDDDRKKMLKTFIDKPSEFSNIIKEIKDQKAKKYKFLIINPLDDEPLPEKMFPKNIYYSEDHAIDAAKKYCEDTKYSFKIMEI